MKISKSWFWLTLLVAFNGSLLPAFAHDDGTDLDKVNGPFFDVIHSRSYLGGFLSYMGIDNDKDFNGFGGGIGSNPFELDLIPGINSNIGLGFLVGHREEDIALEFSYWRSQHSTYWAPGTPSSISGTATYQSVEFNLKRYICTEQEIQPFLQIGIGNPLLSYPDDSFDGLGKIGTFNLSGLSFDLGGGVELYADKDLSLFGGAFYRWITFDHAYGVRKVDWTALGMYQGDGFDLYTGATMRVF